MVAGPLVAAVVVVVKNRIYYWGNRNATESKNISEYNLSFSKVGKPALFYLDVIGAGGLRRQPVLHVENDQPALNSCSANVFV